MISTFSAMRPLGWLATPVLAWQDRVALLRDTACSAREGCQRDGGGRRDGTHEALAEGAR
jgi:hypothetical protein